MKTIYLARHAKSSWDSDATTDYDRPLSQRGENDAIRMGAELANLGWLPEKISASPAMRAKQTCESLCDQLGISNNSIEWNEDVYAAYTVTLLQIITNQVESVSSVMLVGHNPSMEDLLVHFCGADQLRGSVQDNGKLFTTGNVAKITVDSSWKDLAMGDAKLEVLLRPKAL
jgi:phosphohistidine phosphatase